MLETRVAVVTGGSRGIGRAVAELLASDGMRVVACGRDRAALDALAAAAGGHPIEARVCDVSDEAAVDALFAHVMTSYGRLDVLVSAAGVLERAPVAELTAAAWDRMMNTNVRGAFLCARAAFRLMPQNGGGDIVQIASLSGVKGVEKFPGMSAYVASKFALVGLTEALAIEGRPLGIRVCALSPGAVETELLHRSAPGLRAGMTPAELAKIVQFVLSPAGRCFSGSNLEIFSNA
jgi:NAD(P)-dependent dehydrogenase (short-subunit alcohol dehydrogenase family)